MKLTKEQLQYKLAGLDRHDFDAIMETFYVLEAQLAQELEARSHVFGANESLRINMAQIRADESRREGELRKLVETWRADAAYYDPHARNSEMSSAKQDVLDRCADELSAAISEATPKAKE